MKKLLLGTTALAAAGLLAMPVPKAMAASQPIQIKVGGGFWGFLTGVSQKSGTVTSAATGQTESYPGEGRTNRIMWDKSWISFKGKGSFDNGISAGVDFVIRGNQPSALQFGGNLQTAGSVGTAFAYMNLAQYGRLEVGSTAGAARKMWYGAITPLRFAHGWDSPNYIQTGGSNTLNQPTTLIDMGNADRAEKINYFTPRMAGFQLGVTYAPNNCQFNNRAFTNGDQNNGGVAGNTNAGDCLFFGNTPSKNITGEQNDIVEVGLNYVGNFSGVDLGTYVGFGHASLAAQPYTNNNMRDLEEAGAGANIGYQGFQLGVAFRWSNQGNKYGPNGTAVATQTGTGVGSAGSNPTVAPTNRWDFNVGLTYHTGPWAVGGEYAYAQDTEHCGGVAATTFNGGTCAVGSTGSVGKDKLNAFAIGGNYALGPGVNLNGGIEYAKYDAFDGSPSGTNRTWVYMIGTALYF